MRQFSLAGKVAIVTGASREIGAAVARRLAADGAKIVVHYNSTRAAAQNVVDDINAAGGVAIALRADISDRDQAARLFADARLAFGRVDILVNNTGVVEPPPFTDISGIFGAFGIPDTRIEVQFATDLHRPASATQEAAHAFEGWKGRVINVSSLATRSPRAGLGVDSVAARAPLGGIGRPQDIAAMVALLAFGDDALTAG